MITIELKEDTISPALEALADLLDNLTPVMQEIGEYLVGSTKTRFPRGAAPDGTPWAPKSPATLAAYAARKEGRDPRPLYGPAGQLSRRIFSEVGARRVEVGSPRIYAAVMQFGAAKGAFGTTSRGAPISWGNIPARPFLGLSADDETAIAGIVEDWLARATGTAV